VNGHSYSSDERDERFSCTIHEDRKFEDTVMAQPVQSMIGQLRAGAAALLASLLLLTAGGAALSLAPAAAYPQDSCAASAESSPSYDEATQAISSLPEFKSWAALLRGNSKIAFGKFVDRQELRNGKCFWSVTVYEARDTHMTIWHVFLVDPKTRQTLIQDADGDFVTTASWRRKAGPSRR
jgi:hypothetical protein